MKTFSKFGIHKTLEYFNLKTIYIALLCLSLTTMNADDSLNSKHKLLNKTTINGATKYKSNKSIVSKTSKINHSFNQNTAAITINLDRIKNQDHPRLLIFAGQESAIKTKDAQYSKIHNVIIATAKDYWSTFPTLLKKVAFPGNNVRFFANSRASVRALFYLSYAARFDSSNKFNHVAIAKKVLDKILATESWPTAGYDLEYAEMAFALAIAYDWLYSELSPEKKQLIRHTINKNVFAKFTDSRPFWTANSNWNSVCTSGASLAAMAIIGDATDPNFDSINTNAASIIRKGIENNLNPMISLYGNGSYSEGPMYYCYGTTYEATYLYALKKIYGDDNPYINSLVTDEFKKSTEYILHITGNTLQYFNYNDSTPIKEAQPSALWLVKQTGLTEHLFQEVRVLNNGAYTDIGRETSGLFLPLSMVFSNSVDLTSVTPTKFSWINKDKTIATYRTGWKSDDIFYGVKAAKIKNSHSHMDAGTFVYDSNGVRWANDLGKSDYAATQTELGVYSNELSDISQNSHRWTVFRVANINHNTLSIRKKGTSDWQRHNVGGNTSITSYSNATESGGTSINLLSFLNLNNDLKIAERNLSIFNNKYLKVQDRIKTGSQDTEVYWNMVTSIGTTITKLSDLEIELKDKSGKLCYLKFKSNKPVISPIIIATSSRPTSGIPSNEVNGNMVGFRATIPANTEVYFASTLSNTRLTEKSSDGIKNIEIDEEANTNSINVFPNPFNEFIYLEDINKIKSENVNLKISNSLGFCVFNKTYTTESLKNDSKIYLENLSSGVYFLNIKTGDKTIVKKIIKQ